MRNIAIPPFALMVLATKSDKVGFSKEQDKNKCGANSCDSRNSCGGPGDDDPCIGMKAHNSCGGNKCGSPDVKI